MKRPSPIPFVEFAYGKDFQSDYWRKEIRRKTFPKAETTAIKLCSMLGMVFVGIRQEVIKETKMVIKGIFKPREVEKIYYDKVIYNLVCKGTDEQAKQMVLMKQAAICGAKHLSRRH